MTPRPPEPQPDLPAPETEPLPPLPDGGLARAMPDWLRAEPPSSPPAAPIAVTDPTSFVTEDDLPEWLRQLGPAYTAPAPRAEPSPDQGPPLPTPSPAATPITQRVAQPSPELATPLRQLEPTQSPRIARTPGPEPSNHRRVVAVAGVLLLALGVLAYLYATRGGF